MGEPDYRLETIHRNAGEIAHFAEYIRQGYKPSSWEIRNGVGRKIKFLPRNTHREMVAEVDQTICAYNKTRAELNSFVRRSLGRPDKPVAGDRVMCLRNDSLAGLFNGMQGVAGEIYDDVISFESDEFVYAVQFDPTVFGQVKYEFEHNRESPMPFDYCYAVTCHKVQGSEYDSVLVLEQKCDLWDHRRWAYTAASRAKEKLFWCEG